METEIPNLPQEMIHEILVRLPMKSLLKFKSVSKSWHSLISSKDFIMAHLQRSSKDTSFSSHRIIKRTSSHHPFHFPLSSFFEPLMSPVVVESDYPLCKPNDHFYVVGCCNGLVCIHVVGKGLILWNPSTKQYKKLAPPDHTKPDHSMVMYGLVYDESSDDYKFFGILPLSKICYPNILLKVGLAKVYSLKMDSWRDIQEVAVLPLGPRGKLASNNLYWMMANGSSSSVRGDIVSFDLNTELFGSIDLPSAVDGHPNICSLLNESNGRLCLLPKFYLRGQQEFWLFKQNEVEDSWEKVLNFNYPFFPFGPFLEPISPGDYGEIFVYSESLFSLCVQDGVELSNANRDNRSLIENHGCLEEDDDQCYIILYF